MVMNLVCLIINGYGLIEAVISPGLFTERNILKLNKVSAR